MASTPRNDDIQGIIHSYYGNAVPESHAATAAELTMSVIRSMGCYERFAKLSGLSLNALLVLMALHYSPEPCTQKSIGELMWLPKQTVGSIVNGFKKKGLVDESASPIDGRAKAIFLTEEGEKLCSEMFERLRAIESDALRATDVEGIEAAIASVNAYTEALQQGIDQMQQVR